VEDVGVRDWVRGDTIRLEEGRKTYGDVGARIDGQAVVLVLHHGARDVDASRGSDVESIRVVATGTVAGRVVKSDVVAIVFMLVPARDPRGCYLLLWSCNLHAEVSGAVDAEGLNGRVLHMEALDVGVLHAMGVEESGRRLAVILT
jgi:hypothetical protein